MTLTRSSWKGIMFCCSTRGNLISAHKACEANTAPCIIACWFGGYLRPRDRPAAAVPTTNSLPFPPPSLPSHQLSQETRRGLAQSSYRRRDDGQTVFRVRRNDAHSTKLDGVSGNDSPFTIYKWRKLGGKFLSVVFRSINTQGPPSKSLRRADMFSWPLSDQSKRPVSPQSGHEPGYPSQDCFFS